MKDIWPANLIEELAYRRCIIFIGSGVSATAKNGEGQSPETWGNFLNSIKTLMKRGPEQDKKFVDEMLSEKNYLLALQAIYDDCDPGEYSNYLKEMYLRCSTVELIWWQTVEEVLDWDCLFVSQL